MKNALHLRVSSFITLSDDFFVTKVVCSQHNLYEDGAGTFNT